MAAFWAWYTFPPLMSVTIKSDLGLTTIQVANSNIVSLSAALAVRFLAGPLCDQFGPRKVYGGILLLGALPIGLAPLVKDATGLYASRFFIGILGATFVPCQVWCTGFFDKNIVGTANALAGGWGNAGGGLTYFVMPAIFDSFVHGLGYSPSQAWRLTFIVPLIVILVTAAGMIGLCPDTPLGQWNQRHKRVQENLNSHGVSGVVVVDDVPGAIVNVPGAVVDAPDRTAEKAGSDGQTSDTEKLAVAYDHEVAVSRTDMVETAQGETITTPTFKEALVVIFSWQALFHVFTYACSFGGELAINSILGAYYLKNFPYLGQTRSSSWAAMFGFLNMVTRPMGGVVGDILYRFGNKNLWLKKGWITTCGVLTGALLILIGKLDPHSEATMYGLISLMAVFHEAGNGANFALVPHVYPFANGILSGLAGAAGNLGGVIFAIVFRFMDGGGDYAKAFWVIGIMHIGLNLAVVWIPVLPKGQIGGR
jgi:NNP family nitrate/nitrite transporter-like MFS transporter